LGNEPWHFLINDDVVIMSPPNDKKDRLHQIKYADEVRLDVFVKEGTPKLQFHYGEGYRHEVYITHAHLSEPDPKPIEHGLEIGGEYRVPNRDDLPSKDKAKGKGKDDDTAERKINQDEISKYFENLVL
jgi:hypothetical protein